MSGRHTRSIWGCPVVSLTPSESPLYIKTRSTGWFCRIFLHRVFKERRHSRTRQNAQEAQGPFFSTLKCAHPQEACTLQREPFTGRDAFRPRLQAGARSMQGQESEPVCPSGSGRPHRCASSTVITTVPGFCVRYFQRLNAPDLNFCSQETKILI